MLPVLTWPHHTGLPSSCTSRFVLAAGVGTGPARTWLQCQAGGAAAWRTLPLAEGPLFGGSWFSTAQRTGGLENRAERGGSGLKDASGITEDVGTEGDLGTDMGLGLGVAILREDSGDPASGGSA